MRILVLAAVLGPWLAPGWPAPRALASTQDESPFVLGVLRRDGIVLPFATFDGRRWSVPWPADTRQELPIGLDDVPDRWWGRPRRPESFTLWSAGEDRGPIALTRPSVTPIMCGARVGVRSEFVSSQPLPPPFEQPFPKEGLVTSGPQRIDAIPAIDQESGEWRATPGVLRAEFNRLEDAAAGSFSDWRHPVHRTVRYKTPIQVEALYRLPMDEPGWAAYYVEAVRQYAPGPADEGCGLVTFVTGWIRLPPRGSPRFDLTARVSYCDRRGAAYMLPLGAMRLGGRQFWIYQVSGHEREWYVVARPAARSIELHAEYPAANCPPPRR